MWAVAEIDHGVEKCPTGAEPPDESRSVSDTGTRYLSDYRMVATDSILRLAQSGGSPNLTMFLLADYCEWAEAADLRDDGSGPQAVSALARRRSWRYSIKSPLRDWYHTCSTGAADQP